MIQVVEGASDTMAFAVAISATATRGNPDSNSNGPRKTTTPVDVNVHHASDSYTQIYSNNPGEPNIGSSDHVSGMSGTSGQ
jgi:hypothetical protein